MAASSRSGSARRPSRKREGPTMVLLVRHGRTATTGIGPARTRPGSAPVGRGRRPGRDTPPVGSRHSSRVRCTRRRWSAPGKRRHRSHGRAELGTRTSAGLVECDFGDWTGKRLANLRRKPEWARIQNYPSTFRFPGGESFTEMQQRMWDQLLTLVAAHPGERIVAVSHADPIKAAIAMAAGVSPGQLPTSGRLALFGHHVALRRRRTHRDEREQSRATTWASWRCREFR